MNKVKEFFLKLKPSKRRIIQLYAALLMNLNLKGFATGKIYEGPVKAVCAPGMNCYSCPGAVAACPIGSLQNALSESDTKVSTYVLGIILMFGIMLGRSICGYLCPAGLAQELLYKIPTPKIKKNKWTRILSYLKYFVLAIFVVAIPLVLGMVANGIAVPAFCKYICPIGTAEGAIGLLANPNNASLFEMLGGLFTWKFALLVVCLTLAVFMYRPFCRFMCPLGALLGLFNKIAVLGITIDETKCNHCGSCVSNCKMDVKTVGDHECINCGECKKVCPAHAIVSRKDEMLEYFKSHKKVEGGNVNE